MGTYKPPFEINNRMLSYVSSISEKVGKIGILGSLESRPHLRRSNRIRSIHASLKIEANSLSVGQVRDVINGKTVLGEALEIQEVKNAYTAYGKIKEIDVYDTECLKKFHGILTKYTVEESGIYRSGEEGVFSGDVCIFMAPPARLVSGLMNELFEWMDRERGSVHPLILSSVFHYEFVFIHPFSDGNGRMARLWHIAMLSKWKPVFEYIPLESRIEKCQEEYYEAIAQCHKDGRSDRFIEFMLEQIDDALEEVMDQCRKESEFLSEYVKRLLEVMEYEVPYAATAIMEKLGIRSRETFRKNYLNPAMELNLVRMEIPDKPNSRNQRYIKN